MAAKGNRNAWVAEVGKENIYPEPVMGRKGWRHRYGVETPKKLSPWQLELLCWSSRLPTGMGTFYHLKRAVTMLFPEQKWNDWRELRYRSLCDDEDTFHMGKTRITNHSWVGPAASGKTFDAATFAFLFWMADPLNSYVILTSTSKNKIKQRSWSVIQECYILLKTIAEEHGEGFGPHMLNSTLELQAVKGDSKHAIFAQAIEPGELQKALPNIQGVHAPRICLVIDEADGTPEPIYRTIPNMLKGCGEYVLINSANGPWTRLDSFSKVCTPVGGWGSVNIESERWRTNPVPEFQLPPGVCHHFDGKKSPNVRAGRTLFPFIYTWEDWCRVKDDSLAQGTPAFWSMDRGFWPPEGYLLTVLTESLIEHGNARGMVEWDPKRKPTPIGSLDSGFGGDKCVLRFGLMGRKPDGKLAVQLGESVEIKIQAEMIRDGKKVPAEYQIAEVVQDQCSRRGVEAHYFGVEASGTGRGVAAVLTQEWGEIVAVESGGAPSDRPASEEDERPAKEVYDRRITELWFSVQAFVRGKHLGGLQEEEIMQFCSRIYSKDGRKYKLETKEDFKPRFGRSPDDADAVAVMIEVARQHGMATIGPRADRIARQWRSVQEVQSLVYHPDALYLPEDLSVPQVTGPSWDVPGGR